MYLQGLSSDGIYDAEVHSLNFRRREMSRFEFGSLYFRPAC